MRDASPAFQPDRAGSPGFQLAADAGFQTQTPAELGALELVLTLDAITSRYSPRYSAEAELSVVLTLDAITRGTRQVFRGGGVWTYPLKRRALAGLELVVTLDAVTRFRPARAPQRQRIAVPASLELVLTLDAAARHRDYVAEVLEPETEELLLLV